MTLCIELMSLFMHFPWCMVYALSVCCPIEVVSTRVEYTTVIGGRTECIG